MTGYYFSSPVLCKVPPDIMNAGDNEGEVSARHQLNFSMSYSKACKFGVFNNRVFGGKILEGNQYQYK